MFKRLTKMSEITDSATLIALCESCGESGCDDYCGEYQNNNCIGCPVQEAFTRLSAYEDTGLSPKKIKVQKNMIERHVWHKRSSDGKEFRIECRNLKENGHTKDCELQKLLVVCDHGSERELQDE